jgi:hypothetical protein
VMLGGIIGIAFIMGGQARVALVGLMLLITYFFFLRSSRDGQWECKGCLATYRRKLKWWEF